MADPTYEHHEADGMTATEHHRVPSPPDRRVDVFDTHDVVPRRGFSSAIKRVSWGAIFAGTVVALVVQLGLSLIGLGLGLGTFDPATEADTLRGLGIGAGIWLLLSTLVAFYTGGYVAGRLAGLPRRPDGMIHGIVMWGLVTLFTFYTMTSAIGSILNSAAGVLGRGVELVAQGAGSLGQEAAQAIDLSGVDVSTSEILNEAEALLRDAGLNPDELQQQAQSEAQEIASAAQMSPSEARAELRESLDQLLQQGRALDRQNVVNVLVARTGMSEAEAQQTVEAYESRFSQLASQAQQEAGQLADQAGQTALRSAEAASDAVANAAWWGVIAMLVGVIGAALGGIGGSPHDMPASPAVRRE